MLQIPNHSIRSVVLMTTQEVIFLKQAHHKMPGTINKQNSCLSEVVNHIHQSNVIYIKLL